MSGNTSLDIGSQQCVDIELIEVQVYGRWPITAQMNIAVDGQFCMLKLGLPGKVQVCPLCNSVNRKVAGALVIERKVMHSKSGIHGGGNPRARSPNGKRHAAFPRQSSLLYLPDSGEMHICTLHGVVDS